MRLFTITNFAAFNVSIVNMDDGVTGIPAIDESLRISLIFGGVFVALLGVLVFSIYVSLLLTEFRKARLRPPGENIGSSGSRRAY